MKEFFDILVKSGKSGANLALHLLLPIMVVMMSIMRVLDEKKVLKNIARFLSPVFLIFGLPGLGVFAIIQILFVSFAAPVSTFKILDANENITKRRIAAAFAAILTMSQANAAFPLAAVGLNLPVTWLTSMLGGLFASFLTYKVFTRKLKKREEETPDIEKIESVDNGNGKEEKEEEKKGIVRVILDGAHEGFEIVLKSLPLLVLAIFLVNVLKAVGAVKFLGKILSPVLTKIGIPGISILPIVTKYIAGGTAMMGVTLELSKQGALAAVELNRIAGLIINPFDPVGIAVLASAGKRVSGVVMPAVKGALAGILFRAVLHFIIF